MRTPRALAFALIANTVLFGCGASNPPAAAEEKAAATEPEFLERFHDAFVSKDINAILEFWCWDRVTEESRASVEQSVQNHLEYKVKVVRRTELVKGQTMEWDRNGVTYRPNLEPRWIIMMEFDPPAGRTRLYFSLWVGKKDGRYYIAVPAPA